MLWDLIARRIGYLGALIVAMLVQVVGIVLPAISPTLPGVLISAVLYGGTFLGCVSLVLTMAGRLYPASPARLMGQMTLSTAQRRLWPLRSPACSRKPLVIIMWAYGWLVAL
ncbi:hypothetical protein HAALTHF_46830n [Vreelandella aquamarina]|nr:hypothetical protein HAALTHF_46830n [Halomonas axialensis]